MRRITFLISVVFGCLVSASWLQAHGQITTFDAPAAETGPGQGTLRQKMTAAATIVGNYVDTNFVTHSFVRTARERVCVSQLMVEPLSTRFQCP